MTEATPPKIREAAREIVSRPEFDLDDRGWVETVQYYLSNPVDALFDGINWVASLLPWSNTGAVVYAWAVAIVIVLSAVYLLLRLGRGTLSDPGAALVVSEGAAQKPVADILKEAQEAEALSNWRLAIRLRYAALIAQLAADNLLERRPGKTTREYLNELSQNAPLRAGAFERATIIFELAWYGSANVSEVELANFRQAAEQVAAKKAA